MLTLIVYKVIIPNSQAYRQERTTHGSFPTLLRRRRLVGRLAFKTPNQGLASSFCCRIGGQRLVQKEQLFCSQTPVALASPLKIVRAKRLGAGVPVVCVVVFVVLCCLLVGGAALGSHGRCHPLSPTSCHSHVAQSHRTDGQTDGRTDRQQGVLFVYVCYRL